GTSPIRFVPLFVLDSGSDRRGPHPPRRVAHPGSLKIILPHSFWRVERVGSLDVVDLQMRLRSFADERSWERFHSPKNLAMAVASEAGELVDIFQWLTEEESRVLSDENRRRASEEIADVLIYLLRLG